MSGRLMSRRDGFTLLEMMIILTIIAILAGLATQGIPFLKEKARDRRRIQELSDLQRVIELYRDDTGLYPAAPAGAGFYTLMTENDYLTSWPAYSTHQITGEYIPGVVPTFYEKLPLDPLPGLSNNAGCNALGYMRTIAYTSNGDHYKLIYNCASETDDYDPEGRFYDPARPVWAWAISDNMDFTTWQLGW